jgi:hypothetical protein
MVPFPPFTQISLVKSGNENGKLNILKQSKNGHLREGKKPEAFHET